MNIYVSQIYSEAGVAFPFKQRFQKFLSDKVSESVGVSETFVNRFGSDFDLIFRMSAKQGIVTPEIKGPTVFKRDQDVEFTIFLPFDRAIPMSTTLLSRALSLLISSMTSVLDEQGMDTTSLTKQSESIINGVLEGVGMFEIE